MGLALTAGMLAAFCVLLLAFALLPQGAAALGGQLNSHTRELSLPLISLLREGRSAQNLRSPRLLLACGLCGSVVGLLALGPPGILGGLLLPWALLRLQRMRRERHARRIDACSAELAEALASALAGGRSLRGALLATPQATAEPLAGELERVVVELALGGGVEEVLESLQRRTASSRIEALCGAVELHRSSGGDLIRLMRELAAAFRARDQALGDAHSASTQARFTAWVVAAIPVVVLAGLELSAPGTVSAAFSFLPSALMLVTAAALLTCGLLLSLRIGSVQE